MAAPTAPTLTTLCTEGLKKAGYNSSSSLWSSKLDRAEDYWMEEIKADIYQTQKRLKSLMATAYQVTTNGLSTYSVPNDYGEDLTITLMDGSHYGLAQAGGAASVTLAADEDIGESNIIGREIFIYAGTGINQARQVTAYDTSTKVATISPVWTTQPVANDSYLIVDIYYDLTAAPIWQYAKAQDQTDYGQPRNYSPIGDTDWGEYVLYPVPYRTTGVPWGLKLRYFANLLTLDLAGTMLSTLYYKWRTLWVQGVYAKALEDIDDNRASAEMTKYRAMISQMVSRETYGHGITDMQCQVEDYD